MGTKLSGAGSWFNHGAGEPGPGPADPGNHGTASGIGFNVPGIAVYNRATLGGYWRVTTSSGKSFVVQQTDIGPAPSTGRVVDFTWLAMQQHLGGDPTGQHFTLEYLGKNPSGVSSSSSGTSGASGGGTGGSSAGASPAAIALQFMARGGSSPYSGVPGLNFAGGQNPLLALLNARAANGAPANGKPGAPGTTGGGGAPGGGGALTGGGGAATGSGGVAPPGGGGAVAPGGSAPPANLFGSSGGGPAPGLLSGKSSLQLGRTDQGVDFTGSGAIPAVISGTVTRVDPRGSNPGWPGGAMVVVKGTGASAGKFTYLAENFDPKVQTGQKVKPGDTLGHALGSYPFIEYGWAADAQGTTLSGAHGTRDTHPNHSNTPEGLGFLNYLKSGVPSSTPAPRPMKGGGIAGAGSRGVAAPLIPVPPSAQAPGSVPKGGSFPDAVLTALGAPVTQANRQSLGTWFAREGTKAQFNPMATTQPAAGATQFNSVGVKNYPSFQTGVKATAATLNNGQYPGIVAALKSGAGLGGGSLAGEFLKWSGGGYSSLGLPQFPSSATTPLAAKPPAAPKVNAGRPPGLAVGVPVTAAISVNDLGSLFGGGKGGVAAPKASSGKWDFGRGNKDPWSYFAGKEASSLGVTKASSIPGAVGLGALMANSPSPLTYVKALMALQRLAGPAVKVNMPHAAATSGGGGGGGVAGGVGSGVSSARSGGGGGVAGGVGSGVSSPPPSRGGNVGGGVAAGVGGAKGLF